MRLNFASGVLCAGLFAVSCVQRDYNSGDNAPPPKKEVPQNQDGNQNTTGGTTTAPTLTLVQINPKAFNAFNIWRGGQGSEILDYPQGYDVIDGSTTPDGVFYVERDAYWKDQKFIGVPTEGAKVVNDVLEYPVKNGKQLKLKFTKISEKTMPHRDAVAYCKNQGLRLPTVRELFDFCAAGVTEPNYGPNYQAGKYPSTARCWETYPWSASVYSYDRSDAWLFNGYGGIPNSFTFYYTYGVRCVGGG